MTRYFQVLSRNKDSSGNSYRLIVVYDDQDGSIAEAYEAHSSSPHIVRELNRRQLVELIPFHLTPAEYRATKNAIRHVQNAD